jgi:hypothetical protein
MRCESAAAHRRQRLTLGSQGATQDRRHAGHAAGVRPESSPTAGGDKPLRETDCQSKSSFVLMSRMSRTCKFGSDGLPTSRFNYSSRHGCGRGPLPLRRTVLIPDETPAQGAPAAGEKEPLAPAPEGVEASDDCRLPIRRGGCTYSEFRLGLLQVHLHRRIFAELMRTRRKETAPCGCWGKKHGSEESGPNSEQFGCEARGNSWKTRYGDSTLDARQVRRQPSRERPRRLSRLCFQSDSTLTSLARQKRLLGRGCSGTTRLVRCTELRHWSGVGN